MTRLPVLSGQDVVKALAEIGYVFDHQRGSHIVLRHKNPPHHRVTVQITKRSQEGLSGRLFVKRG